MRYITKLEFVSGIDPCTPVPKAVRDWGLNHRFAIIQITYRPDMVDAFFDEEVWHRLASYIKNLLANGDQIRVFKRIGSPEESLDSFVEGLSRLDPLDKEPPELIEVWNGTGDLIFVVYTEFWVHVGGPAPYADSYTYSLYCKDPQDNSIRAWMIDQKTGGDVH